MYLKNVIAPIMLFVALGVPCSVQSQEVYQYARQCYKALEIKKSDIPNNLNCLDGDRIPLTHHDVNLAKASCDRDNDRGDCDLPNLCDFPDWLRGSCYGNSYLTSFRAKSNKNVTIAFLCRHKTRNTNESDRFDDIAMIMHNRKNGETCWFQTEEGEGVEIDGRKVPDPSTIKAGKFWLEPHETKGFRCNRCHDSGPFIISPWINQAKSAAQLRYSQKVPYRISTPPFNTWPKPVFVSVGNAELGKDDKSCTSCHYIASKRTCLDENESKEYSWINLSLESYKRPGHIYEVSKVYMPPKGMKMPLQGKYTKGNWNDRYKKHVKKLQSCCAVYAKNPSYKGDSICHKD